MMLAIEILGQGLIDLNVMWSKLQFFQIVGHAHQRQ